MSAQNILDRAKVKALLAPELPPHDYRLERYDFVVPYTAEGSWEEMIAAAAPGTDRLGIAYELGSTLLKPKSHKDGLLRVVLLGTSIKIESMESALQYARLNRLHLTSPYHVLAFAVCMHDLRDRIDYAQDRGPGLFATVPVGLQLEVSTGFGIWYPAKSSRTRAKLVPYFDTNGPCTYFLFAAEPWVSN